MRINKIGDIQLKSKTILAPMTAINCTAFRLICKEHGAGLVYSEMIDVDDLLKDTDFVLNNKLNIVKQERPINVQLVGSKPEKLVKAAHILEKTGLVDMIDFNMGCCEKTVLGKKAGVYLIKHPNLIKRLVKPLVENVSIPVTAKIRSGWDDNSVNAVEVSQILEDCGVSAIAVHPRTRKQGYRGKADWKIIRDVKENTSVPIIGNGDIQLPGHAKAMIEQTKCDFVMIGRAAKGNPFIFSIINYLFEKGRSTRPPTEKEQIKAFYHFLELYKKHNLAKRKGRVTELKHHAIWFTRGFREARRIKARLLKCKTLEWILGVFEKLEKKD